MDNNLTEVIRVIDKTPKQKILKKDPEDKLYLICITGKNNGDEDFWELVHGRTEAYELIKDNAQFINFESSFILVESAKLMDRKSIISFMKYVEQFYNDSFDINDYIKGDWDEDDYQKQNDIDGMFMATNTNKLDMASFMNGDINSTSLN